MSPWESQPGHDISDPWRKGPIRGRTIPTSLGPMLTNGVGGGTGRGQAGNVSLVFSVYSKVQLACIRGQVFSLFKLSRRTAEAILGSDPHRDVCLVFSVSSKVQLACI